MTGTSSLKVACFLSVVAGTVVVAVGPTLMTLTIGAVLIIMGAGGFVSLLIMSAEVPANTEFVGGGPSFLDRLFRRERERQYCPNCGAPLRFVAGLGPFAGLPGGWYCKNCKSEVAPPTRSPEYRREQRARRIF